MSDVVVQYVGISEDELDEFMQYNIKIETVGKEYEYDDFTPDMWNAINEALDRSNAKLGTIQNKIAMKTGKMRKSIKDKIIEQVDKQRNKRTITVSLSNAIISMLADYLKYHTIGHPNLRSSFVQGYKNPTTEGTEPFHRTLFLHKLKELYEHEIHTTLKLGGFL